MSKKKEAPMFFRSPETGKPYTGVFVGRCDSRPQHISFSVYKDGVLIMPNTEFPCRDVGSAARYILGELPPEWDVEKRTSMKTATGNNLLKAYSKCVKRLKEDGEITAASTSAGFIIPSGQKRGQRSGVQVFVRVCRFSEALLKKSKRTGGLLCEV